MRVLLRSTLITLVISIGAITAWLVFNNSGAAAAVDAASELQVPRYCVSPELSAIRQLLGSTTDPAARQVLLAKQKAARQAALECAANATAHPVAPKPTGLAAPFIPTSVPVPTGTLEAGIRHAELLPAGDFLPAEDGNNMWAGTVNGRTIQVFAGSVSGADDNWQQTHPDWAQQPELHVQGALRVILDFDASKINEYPTPGRHGPLHLVAACGSMLILQAADNTLFTFDVVGLAYLNGPSASCPTPTP